METPRKPKRIFSPEQKLNILQCIDADIRAGLGRQAAIAKQGIAHSLYHTWKRQLAVGVKASLRNGKFPVDQEKKKMERRIQKLEAIVLSQSQVIADLKKETNWD